MAKVAVIGAGLSGLAVARALSGQHAVTVFEKSRGVGGRLATRYAGGFEFDHGAQFLTARSARFRRFLAPLAEAGVIAPWHARFIDISAAGRTEVRQWDEDCPHYVGAPRMNALGKYLADGLDVRKETRVAPPRREKGQWRIESISGEHLDEADWLILTAPAAQSAELAPPESPVCERAAATSMSGCCALMLGLSEMPDPGFDAALVRDADISWISVNSSKPGRKGLPALVVHSTNAWADDHRDWSDEAVTAHMLAQLDSVLPLRRESIRHCGLQRWRYANLPGQRGSRCVVDADLRVAACGDWLVRGRVEAAYSSAGALIDKLSAII